MFMMGHKTRIGQRMGGFTLVELLAVITIILLLATLVIGAASYATRKADTMRCTQRMELIKNALSLYFADYNTYSLNQNNLFPDLFQTPISIGRNPYLTDTNFVNSNNLLVDPWGNAFGYTFPGVHNAPTLYDLWSNGPDGVQGTGDDINNWGSAK